ncbi:hypothetical protein [Altericroceibacterium endophyticum]|uniref:class I SAM-dependent methyltransferase n=1 Tax=Altericroceibacterium endophyticum TaxID=1808508 RepID=UPI00301BD44B
MESSENIAAVLADSRRDEDRARDVYRHPAETLAFFQVEPGMAVVDYMPSSGWYTRVLVPYLGSEGHYIGLNPKVAPDATGFMASLRNYSEKLPAQVEEWVGDDGTEITGVNLGSVPESLDGTVDRFLIFREMHNILRNNWLQPTLVEARKLLKDDGLIGVVQHRAKEDAPASYTDGNKGYLRQKDVIALFEAHGFDLVNSSEINANPKDPANHVNGVWMLPPGLGGATDETRPALEQIGESDRMTLLFRKRP